MAAITIAERVLVHLSRFVNLEESFECPVDVTQRGISDVTGVSRPHISLILKRLQENEEIRVRKAHVPGKKCRLKVYFPTSKGLKRAERAASSAMQRQIPARLENGELKELTGEEVIDLLERKGLTPSEAIQKVLAEESIDLSTPESISSAGPLTSLGNFFGRQKEIQKIGEWLSRTEPHVIVITGVTGIGKTTLITKISMEHDGPVYFHNSHKWDTPMTLTKNLATFLSNCGSKRLETYAKVSNVDPREISMILQEDLQDGLLVFDDCDVSENVQDLLSSLLRIEGGWGSSIIVASKRKPSFYNRGDVYVKGTVAELNLGGLDRPSARALLERKYGEIEDSKFEEIYTLTDGHPLSLQLMSLEELPAGRADFLTYIYEEMTSELSKEEEEALAECSVFPGVIPKEFMNGISQRIIERLVELSLIRKEGRNGYSLHDMVREFFLEGLDRWKKKECHSKAADYYLEKGDEFKRLYHLVEAGRYPEATRLLFRKGREMIQDGRERQLGLLMSKMQVEEKHKIPCLLLKGEILSSGRQFEEAIRCYEKVLRLGEPEERLEASIQIGNLSRELGDFVTSEESLRKALDFSRRTFNAMGEARAYRGLGSLSRARGRYAESLEYLNKSLGLYEKLRNGAEKGKILIDLGLVHLERGEVFDAKNKFKESMRLLGRNDIELAALYNYMGQALMELGNYEDADEQFRTSVELAESTGQMRMLADALCNSARNHALKGEIGEAKAQCETSLDLSTRLGDSLMMSSTYAAMATVFVRAEKWDKAVTYLKKSIDSLGQMNFPAHLAKRYNELGNVYELTGRPRMARKWKKMADGILDYRIRIR